MKLHDEHRTALGLGISGGHRVGKTTVAQIISEVNNRPFVTSSASAIAKDMGIPPDIGMAPAIRMEFQERVLSAMVKMYDEQNGLFVSDRTPLDMAAYALTDWHPSIHSERLFDEWVWDYTERCMDLTGKYFFLVSLIQPGLKYVVAEGKPAPNAPYQELLNTTIMGLASDPRVKSHFAIMPREELNKDHRANIIAQVYTNKITAYVGYLASVLPVSQ